MSTFSTLLYTSPASLARTFKKRKERDPIVRLQFSGTPLAYHIQAPWFNPEHGEKKKWEQNEAKSLFIDNMIILLKLLLLPG